MRAEDEEACGQDDRHDYQDDQRNKKINHHGCHGRTATRVVPDDKSVNGGHNDNERRCSGTVRNGFFLRSSKLLSVRFSMDFSLVDNDRTANMGVSKCLRGSYLLYNEQPTEVRRRRQLGVLEGMTEGVKGKRG
jgi:hypothetical protein